MRAIRARDRPERDTVALAAHRSGARAKANSRKFNKMLVALPARCGLLFSRAGMTIHPAADHRKCSPLMPATFSFGKIQLDLSPRSDAARAQRDPDSPFRLVVVGDFTGRTSRGVLEPFGLRRPLRVDCDNFDQVMGGLGAVVRLPAPDASTANVEVRFESLDDFHPDRLLRRLGLLAALAQARERLQNPATAGSAVAEAQQLLAAPGQSPVAATPSGGASESIGETMARLLRGGSPPASQSNKPSAGGIGVNALIENIVASSVVPAATPEQTAALAAVEMELAARLRAILHHPHFQSVEASWRGLDLLVRAHGGEENVQLFVFDVSREELASEICAGENLEESGLHKALGGEGWAVLVGAFTFDAAREDLEVLGRLAKIAALHGGAFVAGASPHFVGCDAFALRPDPSDWTRPMSGESTQAWAALRTLAEARHLGLVLPRVLIRQPYGKGSDPIETFAFEEIGHEPAHESFLWGCGAFVAGHLLTDLFRADGWEMTVGGPGELDELPVFKFVEEGEIKVKPCAEVWLSERTGERVLEQGLMPLLSIKGRGGVRLSNLQSVAQPAGTLSIRRD
jgi:type VI secretion system protein ImpC